MDTEKISRFQLAVLMMGFLFYIIINPTATAKQDGWVAYLISWAGGFIVLAGYVYIARKYPGQTLVDILKKNFGRYIGSIISLLYIWYFIHLAAIVIRNFAEFIVITNYPETPLGFVIVIMIVTIAYSVRNGLEVMGRTGELFIPMIPVMVILTSILLFNHFDINSFKPFFVRGFKPILTTSIRILSFSFADLIVFLMIFPSLNRQKDLLKTSMLALAIMGAVLFIIILRDFFILGADMLADTVFPFALVLRLLPGLFNLDPIVKVNILVGGMCKVSICIYAAARGLAQIFNLNQYKQFVLPISFFVVVLAICLYGSTFEAIQWAIGNYFYYAFPFQFIFPTIIFIISLFRRKKV